MVTITVTTARDLPKAEAAAIERQLAQRYTNVKLDLQVDPSLIGGIKLRIGTTEIDATVLTKLQTIKQQLLRL